MATSDGGEIFIEATHPKFDPNDSRWKDQVAELTRNLQGKAGSVRRQETSEAGTKGGAAAIILALGTSGAVTAAVQIFVAWLKRDKDRSVTLTVTDASGRKKKLSVTGKNVTEDLLRDGLKAGAGELSDGPT